MNVSSMIKTASGFQSSVNIAYDLNNKEKVENYIPTKSAMQLLGEILRSTRPDATDRARILIGAYGKGKSHIVLMIMSILMQKDIKSFKRMYPILKADYPDLLKEIEAYKALGGRILPVVVTGNAGSVSQALILALQHTLSDNGLEDCMPETTYKAAVAVINKWKENFPDTYARLEEYIDCPVNEFVDRLLAFDTDSFNVFEKAYFDLTSGSAFSPFAGAAVVDLFEDAVKGIKDRGYSGIYIVFDEFSKYLESHAAESARDDTKVLQDLAEKCVRSADNAIHIMLISHKEITSYVGTGTAKQVLDGWRGVSERFTHVYLNNNFSQTYEIIAAAIEKDTELWKAFKKKHASRFRAVRQVYANTPAFGDLDKRGMKQVINECYPLHPVTTYILPRLSERVAQNERTLFTFISGMGPGTLSDFIACHDMDNEYHLATPDMIYDYFQPLLKQEVYAGSLHTYYLLSQHILAGISEDGLKCKLIKALALVYILEQFENIAPTEDVLVNIYSNDYPADKIHSALTELIDSEYVIYLKRSNGYLKLKESSGVDIKQEIAGYIERNGSRFSLKDTLNTVNFDKYMFPSRYNDEKEMTRYFAFDFIDSSEIDESVDLSIKAERYSADGVVLAVLDKEKREETLIQASKGHPECVIATYKDPEDVQQAAEEFVAVSHLRESAAKHGDTVLYQDYDVVYDDLRDILQEYISGYTRPEKGRAVYYHDGTKHTYRRKAELTELLSKISDELYPHAPVINNEVINRTVLTGVTRNSRTKVLAALTRDVLEPGLGLTGTGQDISIMRSTLANTGLLVTTESGTYIHCEDNGNLGPVINTIMAFIQTAKVSGTAGFADVYQDLISSRKGIGLRKGLVPIYLAAVLQTVKTDIIINGTNGEMPFSADTLLQIDSAPELFHLKFINWDADKEAYIRSLARAFLPAEEAARYPDVYMAVRRWYLKLPKYAKELARTPDGAMIPRGARKLISELKRGEDVYESIFVKYPAAFGREAADEALAAEIIRAKELYDHALGRLKDYLLDAVKDMFRSGQPDETYPFMSTVSVCKDWHEGLDDNIDAQLFPDGTERLLKAIRETGADDTLIESLAQVVTGLRMADWGQDTIELFLGRIEAQKITAEQYSSVNRTEEAGDGVQASDYQLSYTGDDGSYITKRFDKADESPIGKRLRSQIAFNIRSFGKAVSEQEIRQILMDILKEHC